MKNRISQVISWKAQKDQISITFKSTFWLNKDRISHHRKAQNKNFLVTGKYHLSINLLLQKRSHFPSPKIKKKDRISHFRKVQNKNFSVFNKYRISINFLAHKRPYFPPPKNSKHGPLASSKQYSMLKKISYRCFFFFWGLKYIFHFLKHYASFFLPPASCVE